MVDVSIIATALGLLFTDECDVYRYTEQTDSYGGTQALRGSLPALSQVPCLISHTVVDAASNRLTSHLPLDKRIALHAPLSSALRAGDYVVARKRARGQVVCTYRGTIGAPAVYPSHLRAELELDEAEQP
jgi:hypothetical protein